MPILGIISSQISGHLSPSYNYLLRNTNGFIYGSTNAIAWSFITSQNEGGEGIPGYAVYSLFYANNILFATNADSTIYSSTNGTTWNYQGTNRALGGSLVYLNGKYYSTFGSMLISSTDAITWNYLSVGTSGSQYLGIAYGNSTYVAVGDGGYILSSTDGITWTSRTPAAGPSAPGWFQCIYADSKFVVVGYDQVGSAGAIQTSTDGITWTNRTPSTGATSARIISDVTYGGTKFVAATNFIGAQVSTNGITSSNK